MPSQLFGYDCCLFGPTHGHRRACPTCGAEARYIGWRLADEERASAFQRMTGLVPGDPSVELQETEQIIDSLVKCPMCRGTGLHEGPTPEHWSWCPVCDGATYALDREAGPVESGSPAESPEVEGESSAAPSRHGRRSSDVIPAGGKSAVYLDLLGAEGFRPELDSDGDVVFQMEGMTYYIIARNPDPEVFTLVCPNFWLIEGQDEHERVLSASNDVNRDVHGPKVYLCGTNVMASLELLLPEPENIGPVLLRALGALRHAVGCFREAMVRSG